MNIDRILSSVAKGRTRRRRLVLREASAKYCGINKLAKNIKRTVR